MEVPLLYFIKQACDYYARIILGMIISGIKGHFYKYCTTVQHKTVAGETSANLAKEMLYVNILPANFQIHLISYRVKGLSSPTFSCQNLETINSPQFSHAAILRYKQGHVWWQAAVNDHLSQCCELYSFLSLREDTTLLPVSLWKGYYIAWCSHCFVGSVEHCPISDIYNPHCTIIGWVKYKVRIGIAPSSLVHI